MKVVLLLLVSALYICGTAGVDDWKLVWADEFNETGVLNDCDWKYEMGGDGCGELQFYTSHRPENARQENGLLVMKVNVEPYGGRQFTSARVITAKAWTYGKFEARARLPKGKQLWPAIWMMPQNSYYGVWAASGEIDVMENRGTQNNILQGSIHYGGTWPNHQYSGSGEKDFGKDFSADFHTFTLEWEKNEMRWYVDGNIYHTENINKSMWSGKGVNPYTGNGQPFDRPFFWVLNVAVSGNFFPVDKYGPQVTPDEANKWEKPSMEVDYLRVYQKQ